MRSTTSIAVRRSAYANGSSKRPASKTKTAAGPRAPSSARLRFPDHFLGVLATFVERRNRFLLEQCSGRKNFLARVGGISLVRRDRPTVLECGCPQLVDGFDGVAIGHAASASARPASSLFERRE